VATIPIIELPTISDVVIDAVTELSPASCNAGGAGIIGNVAVGDRQGGIAAGQSGEEGNASRSAGSQRRGNCIAENLGAGDD